jgi:hypothetical protein
MNDMARNVFAIPVWGVLCLLMAVLAFSTRGSSQPDLPNRPARSLDDSAFLSDLAQRTWTYFDTSTTNHLPWSWWSDQASLPGGDYANPAEIGLHMLSQVGAYEMGQAWSPNLNDVVTEVTATLDQLIAWQSGSQAYQPHGPNAYNGSVFYQWYWVSWSPPVVGMPSGDHLVPSIDNALLATSLITLSGWADANNFVGLAQKTAAILDAIDFRLWYDSSVNCFRHGAVNNPQGGICWDYYSDEGRLIPFVARALGSLSAAEFEASLNAFVMTPRTYTRAAALITVERAAWDGSYFTYAAPALFVREMDTAYGSQTIDPATEAQIAYAQDRGYAAWGFSDCFAIRGGGYGQQGAPPAAMQGRIETHPGLVTPHASALALITSFKDDAVANLQLLAALPAAEGEPTVYHPAYGFRDCVNVDPSSPVYGVPSYRFSALAQAYTLLSIANVQTNFIWDYFYDDAGVRRAHEEMFGAPPRDLR